MSFKARFRSERDLPLVTQEVDNKPMITVENYFKWYDLYLIHTDGTVQTVNVDTNKEVADIMRYYWRDHYIEPNGFKKIAEKLGAVYDTASFESVCRRYELESLPDSVLY